MDIATLKYFAVVARTRHMTKAAQQLNITQPSLSASIRRLEAEIGFQLFDRTGRGIQLNEYGEIFLRGVTAVENIMDSCMNEMEELKQRSVNFVRLACSISPANSQLINLLLSRGLNLKVENIPENWEYELVNNNCDLVITLGRSNNMSIDRALLRYHKLAVVANKAHPLADAKTVTKSDLNRHSFCSTTGVSHSLISLAKDLPQSVGFNPRITFLGRDSADMIKAIRSNRCLGLMVVYNLPADDDLVILPVENFDIELPISLYWRKNDTKNASQAFMRQSIIEFYMDLPIPNF
ncbi:MAG: LysR family transcriptional regulator [Peptococcaceae bacterium]|jgi:DNA-binding transcriptional LysR family regulator|nr:LysR family transcriptional regulator [Peptococcaceae bacterium]